MLTVTNNDGRRERDALDHLGSRQVDGIIIVPTIMRLPPSPDGVPLVVDAGALDRLRQAQPPGAPSLPPGSLLTPHAGELARLLGVERAGVESDPIGHAREVAAALGACVLLKGATQYCAAPDGSVLVVEAGPAWTATAGSGDVLAGIAGALLAAGVPALRAGALAAALQARAAAAMPGPHTPDEVAALALPGVIAALPT